MMAKVLLSVLELDIQPHITFYQNPRTVVLKSERERERERFSI